MLRDMEILESRLMFSSYVPGGVPLVAGGDAAVQMTATAKKAIAVVPRLLGTFTGTRMIDGEQVSISLSIVKQNSKGKFWGVLVAPEVPQVDIAVNGSVNADRTFAYTMQGTGTGKRNTLAGEGAGRLSADGRTFTIRDSFVDSGNDYGGLFRLRRSTGSQVYGSINTSGKYAWGIRGEQLRASHQQLEYDGMRPARAYGWVKARSGRVYRFNAVFAFSSGDLASVELTVSGGLLAPSPQTITIM